MSLEPVERLVEGLFKRGVVRVQIRARFRGVVVPSVPEHVEKLDGHGRPRTESMVVSLREAGPGVGDREGEPPGDRGAIPAREQFEKP